MSSIISPIEFLDFTLIAFDINLHGSLKAEIHDSDTTNFKFDVDIKPLMDFEEAESSIACKCILTISSDVSIDNGETFHPVASIKSRMAAFSEYNDPSEVDQELSQLVLGANTISFLWAKIRDLAEQLSSSSTVGMISLPAIDPYAVLTTETKDEEPQAAEED